MQIEIFFKHASRKILQDKEFIQRWNTLAEVLNHAMITQEYEFVSSWYQYYHQQYDPLLVIGYQDKSEDIIGILPLALSRSDGSLCHAGEYSSGYHGWLCFKAYETDFLINSLITIKQQLNIKKWQWLYLPPDINTAWLRDKRLKKQGIFVKIIESESPIYELSNSTRIDKVRKHRSLRPLINRLKRGGELKIEKISNKKQAEKLFNEMANQSNFRKLGLYNYLPFSSDPIRKEWYLSRLEKSDNIQFVILWQGDKVLACSLAYCSCDHVIGMMFSYDPVESSNSPGTVFFILYIDFLKKSGYKFLDFTPGGESYKERFCNNHKTLVQPVFTFKYSSRLKQEPIILLKKYYKAKLQGKKINRKLANLKMLRKKSLLVLCKNKISSKLEGKDQFFIHTKSSDELNNIPTTYKINKQKYTDIFLYNDINNCLPRKEVAEDTLRNFSRRDFLYTIVYKGELLLYAWLAAPGKKHWEDCIYQCLSASKNNYVIYDLYINPSCATDSVFLNFIAHMATEFSAYKQRKMYLVKPLGMDKTLMLAAGFSKK
jgi:hypothetical protein